MTDRAEIQSLIGCDDTDPFLDFMVRVDAVVRAHNTAGFGVYDFADAAWMDLFEDAGSDASDEAVIETLADADGIFAEFQRL